MDSWVDDESLFISRRLGSAEGVIQVFRCLSLDTPMGDHSFSLIGETANPFDIDPQTDWVQKDYLRLLEFLEVNSAMVNIRGHVLLKSEVKSRRAGRPDGPATYWRCFDLLPMHAFGLVRPVDTFSSPKFLIICGEVNLTTPGKVIDVEALKEGKAKYDKLDAEYKQLKSELDSLKETLGRTEKAKYDKLDAEYKQLKSELETLGGTGKAKYDKLDAEHKQLKNELDSLKDTLEGVKVRERDMNVERQKAKQETEVLKTEVSNLRIQVSNSVTKSVLNDSLEKEKNLGALFVACENLTGWIGYPSTTNYLSLNRLQTVRSPLDLSDCQRVGSVNHYGTWIVYRRGTQVIITCDAPSKSPDLNWFGERLYWEKENQTGSLVGYMRINRRRFST